MHRQNFLEDFLFNHLNENNNPNAARLGAGFNRMEFHINAFKSPTGHFISDIFLFILGSAIGYWMTDQLGIKKEDPFRNCAAMSIPLAMWISLSAFRIQLTEERNERQHLIQENLKKIFSLSPEEDPQQLSNRIKEKKITPAEEIILGENIDVNQPSNNSARLSKSKFPLPLIPDCYLCAISRDIGEHFYSIQKNADKYDLITIKKWVQLSIAAIENDTALREKLVIENNHIINIKFTNPGTNLSAYYPDDITEDLILTAGAKKFTDVVVEEIEKLRKEKKGWNIFSVQLTYEDFKKIAATATAAAAIVEDKAKRLFTPQVGQ